MSDISPSSQAKRKQYIFAGAILIGILALSSLGVWMTQDTPPAAGTTRASDIRSKSYIAPGEKVAPEDSWRGVADTRLNVMEQKMSQLDSENKDLKRRLGEAEKPKDKDGDKDKPKTHSPEAMGDDELDARMRQYEKGAEAGKTNYPAGTPGSNQPQAAGVAQPNQPQTANATGKPAGTALNVQPGNNPVQTAPGNGFLTVKLSNPHPGIPSKGTGNNPSGSTSPVQSSTPPADSKTAPKTTQNYLPSGMFGQAVVLSGLDAPTGGQAQSNPHPVLLQLRDLAILPNRYRYDWKQCTVVGAGYGDLSSERAYIRTESLSCVSKDGKVMDVKIKGYIAGEDGKAGMRGRVVSKQGQALGNALLAGVVSGIGTGIEKTTQVQSVSAIGTTATTKPGDEFKAGIGSGIGKGVDRLANYYITLAEKMFPVIEVDAGRIVDIVLTQGALVDVDMQTPQ